MRTVRFGKSLSFLSRPAWTPPDSLYRRQSRLRRKTSPYRAAHVETKQTRLDHIKGVLSDKGLYRGVYFCCFLNCHHAFTFRGLPACRRC